MFDIRISRSEKHRQFRKKNLATKFVNMTPKSDKKRFFTLYLFKPYVDFPKKLFFQATTTTTTKTTPTSNTTTAMTTTTTTTIQQTTPVKIDSDCKCDPVDLPVVDGNQGWECSINSQGQCACGMYCWGQSEILSNQVVCSRTHYEERAIIRGLTKLQRELARHHILPGRFQKKKLN